MPPSGSSSATALILIDVINDLEFEGGEALIQAALVVARRIRWLKRACRSHGIPAIYINDNFGRWRSDLRSELERCLGHDVRGRPLVELLRPEPDDYFLPKPRHSGFYCTGLDPLLQDLGVRRLILTGLAGDVCVLFTAHDAHMRQLELVVPADCIASERPEANQHTLAHLGRLGADVRPSDRIDLEGGAGGGAAGGATDSATGSATAGATSWTV